jgi:hypothetical protein
MNKRGSHVDVIISFIIFVSFIVFSYVLLQPTLTTQQNKESIASSIESSLVNNLSVGNNISAQTISDNNTIQLINAYNQNYNSVKSWFNISPSDNFGFNFTYQNQTTIGTNDEVPKFSSVYSQAFSVLYITTNNNNTQSGLLTVRVW